MRSVEDEFEEFEDPDWARNSDRPHIELLAPLGSSHEAKETPAPGTSEAKQWEEDWDDAGWDDEDQAVHRVSGLRAAPRVLIDKSGLPDRTTLSRSG